MPFRRRSISPSDSGAGPSTPQDPPSSLLHLFVREPEQLQDFIRLLDHPSLEPIWISRPTFFSELSNCRLTLGHITSNISSLREQNLLFAVDLYQALVTSVTLYLNEHLKYLNRAVYIEQTKQALSTTLFSAKVLVALVDRGVVKEGDELWVTAEKSLDITIEAFVRASQTLLPASSGLDTVTESMRNVHI